MTHPTQLVDGDLLGVKGGMGGAGVAARTVQSNRIAIDNTCLFSMLLSASNVCTQGSAVRSQTELSARRCGKLGALLAALVLPGTAASAQETLDVPGASVAPPLGRPLVQPATLSPRFECGYRPPQRWVEEVRDAVARGEIPDPATRVIPPIRRGQPRTGSGIMPCLSPAHFFAFEDTNQILLTDYSTGQLIDLMISAANDLMAAYGDIYDFVGFWLNFAPHHTLGTAAYIGLENDVTGIGVQSAVGTELFNRRGDVGVGGHNIEGFLITWNINWSSWQPGTEPGAFMTRVALGHEFEHRFAMFLPDLLDGRRMQGYGGFGCYAPGHPNPAVDTQGSVLGIGEWVGSNPAVIQASYPGFYLFNSDTGGLWSYTELYLMGYVSPAEMDAGNSELRYMDDWDCVASDYYGPISTFSSADIIAAAGPRVPDSAAEDKHYRTGWIMIHLPGDPPDAAELAKAVAIHEQQQMDWNFGTLGLGTMNNTLFDDCNCNDVPDADDIENGTSRDCNGNGIPNECEPVIEDCNQNGLDDACELVDCTGEPGCSDCNKNGLLDECDLAANTSQDVNANRIPDECEPCQDNASCDDGKVCTFNQCISRVCFDTTAGYGDLAGTNGACGPDGSLDIFDVFGVLDAFVNAPLAEGCEMVNFDIAGPSAGCGPDGLIDIFDIFAVLDAFIGIDRCCPKEP